MSGFPYALADCSGRRVYGCLDSWIPGLNVEPHLADWKGLGNVAGPARNREMVEAGADLCIALHRTIETSKGTKDCIRQAFAAGIPVYLIEDEQAIPRRIQAGGDRLV